jgi:hypothetical protein
VWLKSCLIALFFTSSLLAVPIGNPASPALLEKGFFISDLRGSNLQLGVVGDDLNQKRFKPRRQSRALGIHKVTLQGTSEVGTLTWNLFERCNIQVELGSGNYQWRWKQRGNLFVSGYAKNGCIWSGNLKAVIIQVRDTTIGADLHAGGWSWMKGHAEAGGIPEAGMSRSFLRYWQIGAGLTQKIGPLFPYIGLAANGSRMKIYPLETGTGRLQSRHKIGLFLGCTLTKGDPIFLNLEWRGTFEQGLSIAGAVRF